jgi:hypothetical protein
MYLQDNGVNFYLSMDANENATLTTDATKALGMVLLIQ